MIKPQSVPLTSVVEGERTGGTGFLVRAGTTYLVTVAHLPTLQKDPPADWSVWHHQLYVSGDPGLPIDLFGGSALGVSASKAARTPRFKFMRFTDQPDRLVDLIVLPLRSEWTWSADYEPLELAEARLPVVGESLHIAGYPTSVGSWPELRTMVGNIVGMDGLMLEIGINVEGGYSGSPALAADGCFMGVLFGTGNPEGTDDHARIIPPGFILGALLCVNGYLPSRLTINTFNSRSANWGC